MINKEELTKKFLSQLSLPVDKKTIRKYISIWWMNPRKSHVNSFRLTEAGFKTFKEKLELASYDIDVPNDIEWNSELILRLDKFLDCPYFLERKSIIVFREKTAVELVLFGGDLRKFGWAKAESQKNNT